MCWIYLAGFVAGVILAIFNVVKMTSEETVAGINERAWYASGYFFIALVNLAFWYAG